MRKTGVIVLLGEILKKMIHVLCICRYVYRFVCVVYLCFTVFWVGCMYIRS